MLIVATNRNPRKALNAYNNRWQIECLFAHTKTRGFNMEDTRLTQPAKLSPAARAHRLGNGLGPGLRHAHQRPPRHSTRKAWLQAKILVQNRLSTPSDTGSQHTQPAHSKTGIPSGNGRQKTSNPTESRSVVGRFASRTNAWTCQSLHGDALLRIVEREGLQR